MSARSSDPQRSGPRRPGVVEVALLHSPLLGPATWEPVARELAGAGLAVRVGDPRDLVPARGALLVAHSNAGLYVPSLADSAGAAAAVYVDAALAPDSGVVALAPDDLLAHLETLVEPDGALPPWHRWWPEEDVVALVPDASVRAEVLRELPRVPLSYSRTRLGAPDRWTARPAAYLAFGGTYADETARARRLGWPVRVMEGGHLHQVQDAPGVADAVLALAAELLP